VLNPLHSEADAFKTLIYFAVAVAVIVVLVLAIRALA
jgi:hypothetical protein